MTNTYKVREIKLNNKFVFLFVTGSYGVHHSSGVVVSNFYSAFNIDYKTIPNSGYFEALELARKFFNVYDGHILYPLRLWSEYLENPQKYISSVNRQQQELERARHFIYHINKIIDESKNIGVNKQVLYKNFPELEEIERNFKHILETQIEKEIGKSPNKTSYVYFAKSNNIYKIGISDNPKLRLDNLRTGSAIPIEIEYVIPSNNPRDIETTLHRRFGNKNVHREWFNISDDKIDQLKLEYKVLDWREISDIF